MQIAYITIRPNILKETLEYVSAFLPFVDDIVVVTPARFAPLLNSSKHRMRVLTDEEVLGDDIERISQLNHQSKNYLLRTNMVKQGVFDDEFIMSDDDARPLAPIAKTYYKESGRYHCYYFYDLAEWRYGSGDFDIGQQNTSQVLKVFDLPHLSYASHMPQIVNRKVFLESAAKFQSIAGQYPLCEWSTYFNYAIHSYPELFHHPRPFQTMCWPDSPVCWPYYVRPPRYQFENFSPHLYGAKQPFQGISTKLQLERADQLSIEKILRWYQFELRYQIPERRQGVGSIAGNVFRKLLNVILRPTRKFYRFISWDDHARLTELSSRIAFLERDRIQNKDKH